MSAREDILRHARNMGLDECEAISARRRTVTVRITESRIAEVKQTRERSLGVRAIHGKRIIAARTRRAADATAMLERAAGSVRHAVPREFWDGLPHPRRYGQVGGTFDPRLESIEPAEAADLAREMINSSLCSGVSDVSGSLNIVAEEFGVSNSNGLKCEEKATYISGMINAESEPAGCGVSGIGQRGARTMADFDAQGVGAEAAAMCAGSAGSRDGTGGTLSVVLAPYAVGELLSFVIAPSLGLKAVSEGRSCFSGLLGSTVASEVFSLHDDPHTVGGIGCRAFDDEGVPTKPLPLVQDGVLAGAYADLYDSYRAGGHGTANASRPGSPMGRDTSPIPVSAPHNLRVPAGRFSVDEMVRETAHGLLVGRLWYAYAVNPVRGDFACTARSGVMTIKNGRITGPAKPVRIFHSLPGMLRGITHVGSDERNVLQWASLPSSTPSVRVDGVRAAPV